MFKLADLGDQDKPLTPRILSNANHPITQHIIYLYTMQSFIYADLNKSCRQKDRKMIQFFGPMAAALGYIIHSANHYSKNGMKGTRTLYRGIKLLESEIETFDEGSMVPMSGYQSTSTQMQTALAFAFTELEQPFKPVLLEIEFTGSRDLFRPTNSAYDDEDEIILQDGLKYLVTKNVKVTHPSQLFDGRTYQLIGLKLIPNKESVIV